MRRSTGLVFGSALLAALWFVALPAAAGIPAAATAAAAGGAGFNFSDWHVNTGQFDFNWQTGAFSTPGHIQMSRPGSDISADHAVGNQKTRQATLTGNVVLHDNNGVIAGFAGQQGQPGQHVPATLTCDNLQIDGVSKTYTATGNVHFVQGKSAVSADRAIMNGLTHDIHLYGNVELTQ